MPKILKNKLIEEFKDRKAFSSEELYDFYKDFEPDLKKGTLSWRIYDLKKKNIIRTVKRGWYTICHKPSYKPDLSLEILKLNKHIRGHFEEVEYCLWETSWLNEFLHHQSSKWMIIVEIEKDFEENLYFQFKDYFNYEVYLNPNEKEIDLYITESHKPIVIKKLISRSPLIKRTKKKSKIPVPQLEKILVDLFSEESLFYFYQGSEMNILFENALKKYAINYTRLLSYAERRGKEEELKRFLEKNLNYLITDILE